MSLLRYSLVRLLILLAAATLLYLVGLRGALLWLVAVVIAGLVAFIALPRSHDRAAADLARLLHLPAPSRSGRAQGQDEAHEDRAHGDGEGAPEGGFDEDGADGEGAPEGGFDEDGANEDGAHRNRAHDDGALGTAASGRPSQDQAGS